MTQPLEHYVEHADNYAQKVVNHWGQCGGDKHEFPKEFKALCDKAHRYREAKGLADNHRQFNHLTASDEAKENEARLEFAKAYKSLDDSAPPPSPQDKAILDNWKMFRGNFR